MWRRGGDVVARRLPEAAEDDSAMSMRAWLWLVTREVRTQRPRLLLLVACIALTGTLFGLSFSAFLFLRGEIRPRLRELFPERRVIVRPASAELLIFKMEGPRITEQDLQDFRAMEEVENAFGQMIASFPISASFQMESIGEGIETDIIIYGVDEGLIANDLVLKSDFPPRPGSRDLMPTLISDYFVDAYNLGLAEGAGMPKLARTAVLGIQYDLILGESVTGLGTAERTAAPQTVRARVSGMTSNPALFGVVVPAETMAAWNRLYAPRKPITYAAVHIDLVTPEDIDAVRAAAERKKLKFEAQREVLGRYLKVVTGIEALLASALVIVVALAAVGVFTTTAAVMRDRRPAWGLHRATGMGPWGVRILATGLGLAAALPAGLIACAAVAGTSVGLSELFGERLGELSFLPADPFHPSPVAYIAIMAFSLIFALVPALLFSRSTARQRPVELLAERSL